ncbi:MAG: ROK family protein [Erysipelothrix sp.]|nr:ROK family protein [Erysipelothrix sp.]
MKTYIGVDLGGTSVRVAHVNEQGEILYVSKSDSFAQSGPTVVLNNIIEMIKQVPNYLDASGIGVGIPGPVDTVRGVITLATNLKDFVDFPVAKTLSDALGLPVFMDNDANVAGLAEALVGAGKNEPIVYYITHSTGIGGALVVNGKVISGKSGYAGEIANIKVCDSDEVINHLVPGAVENEASGTALARRAKESIDPTVESAIDFFKLVEANNEQALALIDDMAYKFAVMMASIAHVVDPHVFVLGGGVTSVSHLYLDKVKAYYKQMVHPGMADVKIVLAKLEEPGIVGAAMLSTSYGL